MANDVLYRMKRLFIHIIIFILSVHTGSGQVIKYGIQDGLSDMEVTAICQGEIFYWIATRDGLNRFDGRNFSIFKKDSTGNCPFNNNIESLIFDSRGLLWIGYKSGGASIYNPRTGLFTHISEFLDNYPDRVISIFEDSDKNIWLGTWEEGVYQLIPQHSDSCLRFEAKPHLEKQTVTSIIESSVSTIWFGTFRGIINYNFKTGTWNKLKTNGDNSELVVAHFLDDPTSNKILCATWNQGLLILDPFNGKIQKKPFNYTGNMLDIAQMAVHRIGINRIGKLFIGTWGQGLFTAETIRGSAKYTIEKSKILNTPIILDIYKDEYQNIWIGTDGDGLYKHKPPGSEIMYQKPGETPRESNVFRLFPHKEGQIWIGTKNEGVYLYDLVNKHKVKSFKTKSSKTYQNHIHSLYSDSSILLIGHDDKGAFGSKLNNNVTNQFRVFDIKFKDEKSISKITAINKDDNGVIWLGTKQSGLKYIKNGIKEKENNTLYSCNVLNNYRITGIEFLMPNSLWISTYRGIYNLDLNTLDINGKYLENEIIYSMAPDINHNMLWLGTSSGLASVNLNDKLQVDAFKFLNQLPNGSVRKTIIDSKNNLWFTVSNRIFCLPNHSERVKEIHFDINGQPFNASCKTSINNEEHLVFGGADGLVLLKPHELLGETNNKKIVFVDLQIDHESVNVGEKIYGKQILTENVSYAKKIEIPYNHKWLTLIFTEIGEGNIVARYKYKLSGLSEQWYDLNTEKSITLSKLIPGDYLLQLSKWEESEGEIAGSIEIIVIPPWWRTKKFYLAVSIFSILSLVFLIASIIKFMNTKHQKKILDVEKRKAEELLEEKVNFFTELSHDLLTPLTLILAPLKDLLNKKELPPLQRIN